MMKIKNYSMPQIAMACLLAFGIGFVPTYAWAADAFQFRRPSDGVSLGEIDTNGNVTFRSSFTASSFYGDGSSLTGITAGTADALTNNPSDCSANQFANAINATADLTCAAISDADVPNGITIDLAATATALAADPADCGDGFYALGVDASGVAVCSAVATAAASASTAAVSAGALFTHTADASAHHTATVDTNANTICAADEYLDGEGNCIDVIEELELDTLAELNSQLTDATLADGPHTTSLAASAITAGTFPSGAFLFTDKLDINGLVIEGVLTEANICADTCTEHGSGKRCQYVSSDSNDVYISTGSSAGQSRNSRTGIGPC